MLACSFGRRMILGALACGALFLTLPNARCARAAGLIAKGDYFPIAVWDQSPENAKRFEAVGINLYVGLYDGPTAKQLAALEKAGMPVVCDQNAVALQPRWNKEIVGWLQGDEPDNAQSIPNGKGYGPPITPEKVTARYARMKAADKEHRPCMVNLGMGVAWDGWYGRGVRTDKPQDYPKYVQGADVASFDIYPVCSTDKPIAGKISFVGSGVKRLVNWVDNKKPVFTCIETTHISNPNAMVTPKQVRDEVWMAIINGARGLVYFSHEFQPKFIEAGLLAHKDIAAEVKKVNAEVEDLASAINDGKPVEGAAVDDKGITIMTRRLNGETYLFATEMQPGTIKATFTLPGLKGNRVLEVYGESRSVDAADGTWSDTFTGYEAHIYHVTAAAK